MIGKEYIAMILVYLCIRNARNVERKVQEDNNIFIAYNGLAMNF